MSNSDKGPVSREVHDLKIICLEAVGWHHWARLYKSQTEMDFPEKFAPF